MKNFLFSVIFLFSVLGYSQEKGISFQAVIRDPDGNYPSATGLTVTLQILDPVTECVLREESHSGVNISDGYLNLVIGASSAAVPANKNPQPALSIKQVFDNSKVVSGYTCSYTPQNHHGRKLRLKTFISRAGFGAEEVIADFNMRAVPFAINAELLNGKSQNDFVNTSDVVTQEKIESLLNRFSKLDTIINNFNSAGTGLSANITGQAATAIVAQSLSGGINSLLPTQAGHSGKVLQTNGTDVSWVTPSSSSGTPAEDIEEQVTDAVQAELTAKINQPSGIVGLGSDGKIPASLLPSSSSGITEIAFSFPTNIFQTTGSPVQSNGAVAVALKSQMANTVLAAPNAANGSPEFRKLLVSDLDNAKSAALYDVAVGVDANNQQLVKGDDSRLSDARTPVDGSVTTSKIVNGAVTQSKISDGSVTDAKIVDVSASKLTGTISESRLPAASSTASGIVNTLVQSFSGLKTFLNGLSVQGNILTTGDVKASGAGEFERIKLASSSATCNSTIEGSLRYNSTSKKMEFCNGSSWSGISAGTIVTVNIGGPSQSIVKSGPVSFVVSYGSGTETSLINLDASKIAIGGSAPQGCSVSSVTGTGSQRTVTVTGCTGTGTVSIQVLAASAKSTTGDDAPAAGPSATYIVDNSGPTAPASVTLGSVPENLSASPTISFSPANDVGGSTVANHQVRILRQSDSQVISDWANHGSGSDITGLSLTVSTVYVVQIRAVDTLGNIGASSSNVTWTSTSDPCLGMPAPGTVCTGGAIFLGSLSPGATNGSGTDRYMTTAGGCGEIPAGQRAGSGYFTYPTADFTPTCSGTDSLYRHWGNSNDIPGIVNMPGSTNWGTGKIETFKDTNYGSSNAAAAIASIGNTAAAINYCDKLVHGGYSDWYLPNIYELSLLYTNRAFIPGVNTSNANAPTGGTIAYYSSSEVQNNIAFGMLMSNGYQGGIFKYDYNGSTYVALVRCVRRY